MIKISELEIGEFYVIKDTKKKVFLQRSPTWDLTLKFTDTLEKENSDFKESYFQYLGKKVVKIEKRLNSKRKEVYTYRPHTMLCLKTGEVYKIAGYYIRTFFYKPTK
tara:strand:+ start:2531 stop:2851 length:321 start_codon:yes stop_codon:yes gene_type:complete